MWDRVSTVSYTHLDVYKRQLKYDTAQGSFCGKIGEAKHTVEATEDSSIVDGKEIKIYAVKDAKDAPWGERNVDVVLECTGCLLYTSGWSAMLTTLFLCHRQSCVPGK